MLRLSFVVTRHHRPSWWNQPYLREVALIEAYWGFLSFHTPTLWIVFAIFIPAMGLNFTVTVCYTWLDVLRCSTLKLCLIKSSSFSAHVTNRWTDVWFQTIWNLTLIWFNIFLVLCVMSWRLTYLHLVQCCPSPAHRTDWRCYVLAREENSSGLFHPGPVSPGCSRSIVIK